MCNICKDWNLGKLTYQEALSNLKESVGFSLGDERVLEHLEEVAQMLEKDEPKN